MKIKLVRSFALIVFFTIHALSVFSQNTFKCIVKDSANSELLPGVSVLLENTLNGAITDIKGEAQIIKIPNGEQTFVISFVGYKTIKVKQLFPMQISDKPLIVLLAAENQQLDEVVVSSTRTNSNISDLPIKVEVLGADDMDEESTIVPGNVGSILGDLSVITIQRTDLINGNDAIRMQGLDARYTQFLRDGLPLYGGFSGSLGVLAIPPLDLKQIEIIKGNVSTLYGGGAIGGLINFISKTPVDSAVNTLTANITTLKEANLNTFFSRKFNKTGFTLFAGANVKTPKDINGDSFADVPSNRNIIFHPRFFFNPNKNTSVDIGFTSVFDDLKGGDINVILNKPDFVHSFFQYEKNYRNTLDINLDTKLGKTHELSAKSAFSIFQRDLNYSGFVFNGIQNSSYTELSDLIKIKKHTLIVGLNFINESFNKIKFDTVYFGNYNAVTLGSFFQDDWQIVKKISLQIGLRYDYQNNYGSFVLPRLAAFYKPSKKWSIRLAAGTGYKVPNLFDFASPSADLGSVLKSVKPENSYGFNADINYNTLLFGVLGFQINQAFYYSNISNPLMLTSTFSGFITLTNGDFVVESYGTDTYIRMNYKNAELYLGYNHTEAFQQNSLWNFNMPFNPKDKISSTLAYEIEGKWRMGFEESFSANQYIYNNVRVHDILFFAAMIERKFKKASIVLNCENLADQRQTQYEKIIEGSLSNPIFKPIWGPIEGRVINLSLKVSL